MKGLAPAGNTPPTQIGTNPRRRLPPPTTTPTSIMPTTYVGQWKNRVWPDGQAPTLYESQGLLAPRVKAPARTRRHTTSPSPLLNGRRHNAPLGRGSLPKRHCQNWPPPRSLSQN